MKSLIYGLLLLAFLFVQSCKNAKSVHKNADQEIVYAKVSLEHLLDSLAVYHNKPIETVAYYVCRFENNSIMPEYPVQPDSVKKVYDFMRAIWVEERYSKTNIPCDSLTERFVLVRGILDTSGHGHLGEFLATIKKAIIQLP